MVVDDLEPAGLIAAYRVAHAAPLSRSERVLARLRAPGDFAALLPDPRPRSVWPMVVLAIAAAVIAVLALEAMTGDIAMRLGRAERFEAIDSADRVRASAIADTGAPVIEVPHAAATLVPEPAELPAVLPQLPVPVPVQVPGVSAPVELQRPTAIVAPSRPRALEPVATPIEAATPVVAKADREAVLLEEARVAIGRRAFVDAGSALAQHRLEFPQGTLLPERDALQLVVDCRTKPSEATRARARDFIVHQARSPHIRRVMGACRANAPTVVSPFD